MTSVPGLISSFSLDQLTLSQGTGSTQETDPANSAFAALFAQTLSQQAQAPNAAPTAASSGQSSASVDMNSLGQALASGNLAAAQQAFQSLQNDLSGSVGATPAHHHHHHHLTAGTSGSDTASTQAASATAGTSTSTDATSSSQLLSLLMGMA